MHRLKLTSASLDILLAQGQHVATVTAPICANVVVRLKAMRNFVVDFGLVRISFCIRSADAFRDHRGKALLVAEVLAVCTLIADCVLK